MRSRSPTKSTQRVTTCLEHGTFANLLAADAARLITSADIANDTIQSRDIDNKTHQGQGRRPQAIKSWTINDGQLFSRDIANGTLTSEDFTAGVLRWPPMPG